MTEEFLQYIWKHVLFDRAHVFTSEGKQVEILSVGQHNHNSGPDFFDARLRIDGTLWAGNVEVHTKSSVWGQHKHQYDDAYKNVILHIVWEDDEPVMRSDKTLIPAVELKNIVPHDIYERYAALRFSSKEIACEADIKKVDKFVLHSWMDRMVTERLERKTSYLDTKLNQNINDWEETFYQALIRNMGNPVNSDPFERLAGTLPYRIIAKHRLQPTQVEALLFGQAGMLGADFKDNYPIMLKGEYKYLQQKLNLTPITLAEWKFMRIRPPHFPTIRIAQLGAVLVKYARLFRNMIEASSVKDIVKMLSVEPDPYWSKHYRFDKLSVKHDAAMGKATIEMLIINAVVPIMFLYGKHSLNEDICDKALNFLHKLRAEKNHITEKWTSIGLRAADAYDSQALIQLRNEYCEEKRCTQCAIGHKLMAVKN